MIKHSTNHDYFNNIGTIKYGKGCFEWNCYNKSGIRQLRDIMKIGKEFSLKRKQDIIQRI